MHAFSSIKGWLSPIVRAFAGQISMHLLHFTQLFMASGPILYFTGGAYDTFTLSFWIFNEVRGSQYNYPSAVGIFFTVLALPIVFGVRWLALKTNPEVAY